MVTKTIASVVVEMLHFITIYLMNPVRPDPGKEAVPAARVPSH